MLQIHPVMAVQKLLKSVKICWRYWRKSTATFLQWDNIICIVDKLNVKQDWECGVCCVIGRSFTVTAAGKVHVYRAHSGDKQLYVRLRSELFTTCEYISCAIYLHVIWHMETVMLQCLKYIHCSRGNFFHFN